MTLRNETGAVSAMLAHQIALGTLSADPDQRVAAAVLDDLAVRLRRRRWFPMARRRRFAPQMQGIYLHGPAGRGKSMLMDGFQESLTMPRRRVHFHAFMQEVHSAMTAARKGGIDDPVRHAADLVAGDVAVLCLDELDITEIVDAMLVGRIIERLFDRGVVLVATSNRAPDDLFKEGWNRDPFLPFISLIKDRLQIVPLFGATDYRRLGAQAVARYICPLGPEADHQIDQIWTEIARGPESPLHLQVHGRSQSFARFSSGALRVGFDDLCVRPSGAADYLALVRAINLLLLEGVPVLSPKRNNEARRFVLLVDTLYEARIGLIVSAAAEPDALYVDGAGAFEFARTASRLSQMRTLEWWHQRQRVEDRHSRTRPQIRPPT